MALHYPGDGRSLSRRWQVPSQGKSFSLPRGCRPPSQGWNGPLEGDARSLPRENRFPCPGNARTLRRAWPVPAQGTPGHCPEDGCGLPGGRPVPGGRSATAPQVRRGAKCQDRTSPRGHRSGPGGRPRGHHRGAPLVLKRDRGVSGKMQPERGLGKSPHRGSGNLQAPLQNHPMEKSGKTLAEKYGGKAGASLE